MRIRYFIGHRFNDGAWGFQLIGVWMHHPSDDETDIYYPYPESPECEEANCMINRLLEGDR